MIKDGRLIHREGWAANTSRVIRLMLRARRDLPEAAQAMRHARPSESTHGALLAYVNQGRWVVDCPFCPGAELVWKEDPVFMCLSCFNEEIGHKTVPVKFPARADEIEAVLDRRAKDIEKNCTMAELQLDDPVAKLEAENRAMGVM